ncbi:arrestin domain-containing protein 1-like [Cydia pomonella]|uniref:arrestin domain-containing protein 1-like n=1 Tax=Cydia pomonella TaxID=82600 RepID=UPI002ADD9E84|nr:arrestin domain-containing protein 1-like [Cydia pomonella]XP_061719686.1 arrestin domain-containing protein 1-like [Cydia pomonella]
MSGFENGSITLDEERDVYYAGQVLSGKLEFGINQPLQFKAINLVFHGEANVSWEETEVEEYDGVRSYNNIPYGGEEVFFHVEQCVCGGVGVSQLQPGSHMIPFRFQIPPTVPSSFGTGDDDEERTIYYFVKAVLEYHDGRESEELEKDFEVVVPLDLNLNPEMQVENEVIFEEAISSCFCGSGLLKVIVTLPATGFAPAMVMPIAVKADNQSSVEVTKIIFELVQRVKYFSTDPPSKKEEPEVRLQYSKTGAIPAKTRRNFEHNFRIPDLIPVITQNCNTIKVGYFFKIKIVLSGCNDDVEDEMEICLGQIPIREMIDGEYVHPLQSDLPMGPMPHPGEPPIEIPPYVYPSQTIQVVSTYTVSAYPGSYAPPAGYPYPNQNQPYPGANPSPNPPYPGANPPYPGVNLTTGPNPPYPGPNPPYPSNPAPAAPVIGFVASPAYPPATGTSTPFNPSAPPE